MPKLVIKAAHGRVWNKEYQRVYKKTWRERLLGFDNSEQKHIQTQQFLSLKEMQAELVGFHHNHSPHMYIGYKSYSIAE